MDSFLFTVAAFVVALAILIAVHEFGHFWVARRLGVKVLRFSIGFGRALWQRRGRVDGTEYVIAAVPLGGYVKMLDEREGAVEPGELGRAFNRQSLGVRSAVVVAGPAFNFLFAILAFWLVFVAGDSGTRPLVGGVAEGSVAAVAGIQPGDEVVAVDGRLTPTWESVIFALLRESEGGDDLAVRVRNERGLESDRVLPGERLAAIGDGGDLLAGIGLEPRRPEIPAVIGEVVPGEAAARAGLRTGDRVLAAAGEPVATWAGLVELIRRSPGAEIPFEIERGGDSMTLPVRVGETGQGDERIGRIGAAVQVPEGLFDAYRTEVRYGPLASAREAVYKTWDMSLFMVKMLGRMLIGEASVKNLGGPISIAQSAGKSASYGVVYFLKFLALVSISLGVINLMPVPVLDGGHLLFFLVEAVKGRPLSDETMMHAQRVGMLILLLLMGLAFYVDLSRLLG